jgi:hypothetical protein
MCTYLTVIPEGVIPPPPVAGFFEYANDRASRGGANLGLRRNSVRNIPHGKCRVSESYANLDAAMALSMQRLVRNKPREEANNGPDFAPTF